MKNLVLFLLLGALAMASCREDGIRIPKPRMYPKVTWPERVNTAYQNEDCPFAFSHPDYFEYTDYKNTSNNPQEESNDCWFNLVSTSLNSTLFFSYYSINDRQSFDNLVNESFEMVDKHNIKASSHEMAGWEKPGVSGILFEIKGPVAAPLQFFLTDSVNHFVRASLYFNSRVNVDSTQVLYDFIKQDVEEMMETFVWQ